MDFNLITNNEVCHFFVTNVLPLGLIYYSHISTAIVALLFSAFVFFKSRDLSAKLLFGIGILFVLWSGFDLVTWTNYDTRKIMFSWSVLGVLYMLIFSMSLYFTYSFFEKKDISFWKKFAIFFPIVPIALFTPMEFNLSHFNNDVCEAIEGFWFTTYYHIFGAFILLWVFILSIYKYRITNNQKEKRKILLFSLGIELFLVAFFLAGYISSLLDNYLILIYGLFGMPIFMGVLAYLIVQYHIFNVKLLLVQALVVTISALVGAQLFFVKSHINFVLTSITLVLSLVFGVVLIRSVKREIAQGEELRLITKKLASTNRRLREIDRSKSEFLSIASHQLRTPLTAIKGFVALIVDGSYGNIPTEVAVVLKKIYTANERIIELVENLLNISRIESGRMQYDYSEVDLVKFFDDLLDTFSLSATKKGIQLSFDMNREALPHAWADRQKSFEVVSNLIDNAIKYTPAGEVHVYAEVIADMIRISVRDTGVGVSEEAKDQLFVKFSRGEGSGKLYANGTGLGLFVGKSMIEAQGGRIWVESPGKGKGSTFFVELPVKKG